MIYWQERKHKSICYNDEGRAQKLKTKVKVKVQENKIATTNIIERKAAAARVGALRFASILRGEAVVSTHQQNKHNT